MEPKLSGFEKARAIVLKHIAPPVGDGQELAQAFASPASDTKNIEIVYVHNQKAA
jgi:hypothetical protein